VKAAPSLALLFFITLLAGCSSLVDPWPGSWYGAEGQSIRFSADGKVTYSNQGVVYAKGEYTRLGYQAASLKLTAVAPGSSGTTPVKSKRIIKLEDNGKMFVFNRVRYQRRK
jgi:hypothetical protein